MEKVYTEIVTNIPLPVPVVTPTTSRNRGDNPGNRINRQ